MEYKAICYTTSMARHSTEYMQATSITLKEYFLVDFSHVDYVAKEDLFLKSFHSFSLFLRFHLGFQPREKNLKTVYRTCSYLFSLRIGLRWFYYGYEILIRLPIVIYPHAESFSLFYINYFIKKNLDPLTLLFLFCNSNWFGIYWTTLCHAVTEIFISWNSSRFSFYFCNWFYW